MGEGKQLIDMTVVTPANSQEPAFELPPGSCDSHVHVFGDKEVYPFAPTMMHGGYYAPHLAYREAVAALGLDRVVLVAGSSYGFDNTCLLDNLKTIGPRTARAVVVIDEAAPPDPATLQLWHRWGVRGIRLTLAPTGTAADPTLAEHARKRLQDARNVARSMNWHVELLLHWWIAEELLDDLNALDVPFVIGHLGRVDASLGVDQPGFQKLLDVLGAPGNRGWVKLSAPYRCSKLSDYADVTPFAHALARVIPDRLVWGSDYPFANFDPRTDPIALANVLAAWLPDIDQRHAVLVDNPARLYEFDGS